MKKYLLISIAFLILTVAHCYAQKIDGGNFHSLFICQDSTVNGCGIDDADELGDGGGITRFSPVQTSGLTHVIAVSAGDNYSLFLKNDGTVWGCGFSHYG